MALIIASSPAYYVSERELRSPRMMRSTRLFTHLESEDFPLTTETVRPSESPSRRRSILVGCGGAGVLLLIAASIFVLPRLLVDKGSAISASLSIAERLKAENDIRATLLQAVAGLFFFVTAFFTGRQLRVSQEQLLLTTKQIRISEEKQLSELFSEGLRHLGTRDFSTQLGGVYVLGGVARASSEYVNPVAEVLCGLLRTETAEPVDNTTLKSELLVNTILHVLGTLTTYHGGYGDIDATAVIADTLAINGTYVGGSVRGVTTKQVHLEKVTLIASTIGSITADAVTLNGGAAVGSRLENWTVGQADLRRSNLARSHLANFTITRLMLQHAVLVGASLENILAESVDLLRANLTEADLRNIQFKIASCRSISFVEGRLNGLKCKSIDLTGSDLSRCELSDIECEQLILAEVGLTGARLADVDADVISITNCELFEATLTGLRAKTLDVSGTTFAGCKFEDIRGHELITSRTTTGLPGRFTEGATGEILPDGRYRFTNFTID